MSSSEHALEGWVISADRTWVGKLGATVEDGATLVEPAYSLIGGEMVQDGRGNVGCQPMALMPLCSFTSAVRLRVYGGAFIPCGQLDAADTAQLLTLIAGAEQARVAMRAQRSGLVMAGANAMPKGAVRQ